MIGVHVSKKSKILDDGKGKNNKHMSCSIKRDIESLGINSCQIFTHGPRSNRENIIDYDNINEYCEKKNIYISVHCSYPLMKNIWKCNSVSTTNSNTKSYEKNLLSELESCKKLKNCDYVLHLPRDYIENITDTLKIIQKHANDTKVRVLYENIPSSQEGKETKSWKKQYSSPDQLNILCNELKNIDSSKYWGLCIDTAHIWSCGINIGDGKSQEKWFEDLTELSKSRIKLYHLNGSKKKLFNKNRDVHEIAMSADDDIYKKEDAVKIICKFCKSRKIPIICEINRGTEKDARKSLKKIQKLL